MAELLQLGKVDTAVPSCPCRGLGLPAAITLIVNRAVMAILNGNFAQRHLGEGHPPATALVFPVHDGESRACRGVWPS